MFRIDHFKRTIDAKLMVLPKNMERFCEVFVTCGIMQNARADHDTAENKVDDEQHR